MRGSGVLCSRRDAIFTCKTRCPIRCGSVLPALMSAKSPAELPLWPTCCTSKCASANEEPAARKCLAWRWSDQDLSRASDGSARRGLSSTDFSLPDGQVCAQLGLARSKEHRLKLVLLVFVKNAG